MNYYKLDKILKKKCHYNLIIGERSNGKTYAILSYLVTELIKSVNKKTLRKFAIIRRYNYDVVASKSKNIFAGINESGIIYDVSQGQYDCITYRAGSFYLAKYDDKLKAVYDSDRPVGYIVSISDHEHIKSVSYPDVKNIFFDEFIGRDYLQDEFILFMNVLSTFIREQTDIKIFMAGNTINKFCPYFDEMGLRHVKNQEQGTIDLYDYPNGIKIAVEYCGTTNNPSKKFFCFDNPKLSMITNGLWELDIYPHSPEKINKNDIAFIFFIDFSDHILQCEVICSELNGMYLFIHEKTTSINNPESEVIYSLRRDGNPLHFQGFNSGNKSEINLRIIKLLGSKRIYYSDNNAGEIFMNFISQCGKLGIV